MALGSVNPQIQFLALLLKSVRSYEIRKCVCQPSVKTGRWVRGVCAGMGQNLSKNPQLQKPPSLGRNALSVLLHMDGADDGRLTE